MTESADTLNSETNVQPDMGAAPSLVAPAGPEMHQTELPPAWATKLQADVNALQERVAQWQANPPAWFEQTVAELPKQLSGRINLPTQLRQLEQRVQKARDTQTRALVTSSTRTVTASGKGLAGQVAKQLKDLNRRLKAIEKMLGQIQRKMK
jgi:hypothetical protein